MWIVQEDSHCGLYINNFAFKHLSDALFWLFCRLEDEKCNPCPAAYWYWARNFRSSGVCKAVLCSDDLYLVSYEVFETSTPPLSVCYPKTKRSSRNIVFHRYPPSISPT